MKNQDGVCQDTVHPPQIHPISLWWVQSTTNSKFGVKYHAFPALLGTSKQVKQGRGTGCAVTRDDTMNVIAAWRHPCFTFPISQI